MGKVELPAFDYSVRRPQVLLCGNGISLCGSSDGKNSHDSINGLLKNLMQAYHYEGACLDTVPFPMRVVIASDNHVDDACKNFITPAMTDAAFYGVNKAAAELLKLPMDAYLTANYSYDLEMSLCKDFLKKRDKFGFYTSAAAGKAQKRESKYQLHSFYEIDSKRIWHIHGEAMNSSSIIIGHYYYGYLLSHYAEECKRREFSKSRADTCITPVSWLDYFIYGDVYIVGLSLSFEEYDLWWLLGKRYLQNKGIAGTITFYTPKKDESEYVSLLLDKYGVNVENKFDVVGNDYAPFYQKVFEDIANRIKNK